MATDTLSRRLNLSNLTSDGACKVSKNFPSLRMRKRKLVLSEELSDGEMEVVTLNQASVAEEVQWTWKREALQTTKTNIRLPFYSRRAIVEQIADELKLIGDGVYQEFLNSCFGSLMRFDTQGASCKTALHRLLAHEVIKADASPDELWYRVGGRFIRFSKYEYALVTGLSFGPTTFDPTAEHDPPASGLFLRYYWGQMLTMDALRSDFTDGVFRESPADALKVAKLLIVYFLLFGMDGTRTYIDKWAWTLIEDTDRWETFMWGKYTYQILLRYLQQVPTELPNSRTPSYRVYGYIWAFLIWAFEAIPALGNSCEVLTSNDVLPRGIRWRFPKTQVDMEGFCDRQMEVQSTLEPSAEEQGQTYWEHIHDDLRSGVCYVHRKNPCRKKTTSVNPSSRDILPVSRSTPARRPRSTSAKPMRFKKKRKRTDPLTTQEKAHKKLSEHECGRRDEMTSAIQKKLSALVRGELPVLVRHELPSVIHLALKDFFSQRDQAVGGTSSSMRIARPRDENLSLIRRLENLSPKIMKIEVGNDLRKIATSVEEGSLDIRNFKGEKYSSGNGSRRSELSKKGDRNSAQPWTREDDDDDAHTVKNSRASQSCDNHTQAESNVAVKDNEHTEPRASGYYYMFYLLSLLIEL
ncbi:hypothetical protein PHJA_000395400 [Phtheirospermum japonicum]|uniref:DUF1985 domain-containing protein n=1 Tax=Phtheirospermum japonicum TaxID=374723 RepID=A0A830BCL9_9LAMI|nr:hypothetical protein PHJA_000395400 [Phtheirospermum japonicum]